jgi:hypothetical protein
MPSHFLEELAEADEHEVVQQVQVQALAVGPTRSLRTRL